MNPPKHVVTEETPYGTRILIPMDGSYRPGWLVFMHFILPFWLSFILGSLFCWIENWVNGGWTPPRGEFVIDNKEIKITLRNPIGGELSYYRWPRVAVAEIRPNRTSRGLWCNVPGHDKCTILDDLTEDRLAEVTQVLQRVLDRYPVD